MIEFFKKQFSIIRPKANDVGKLKELDDLNKKLDRISSSNVTVLVCGEFKQGKSSFINALINRKVCPVDQDICTAVVSIIHYGEQQRLIRRYGDIQAPEEEEINLSDLYNFTEGNDDKTKETISIDIALPLNSLKGLTIIDTPGVGGLNLRHAFLTKAFLPQADISLFLTDINEPLSDVELTFFCNNVLKYSNQSAVIVTKKDMKSSADDVEAFVLDSEKKIRERSGKEISVLPVSSRCKLLYNKTDNLKDLYDSNFEAIEDLIKDLAGKSVKAKLDIIRVGLNNILDHYINTQKAKLATLVPNNTLDTTLLQQKINELNQKKIEIANPLSPFKQKLDSEIRKKKSMVIDSLNARSILFSTDEFNKILKDNNAKDDNGGQWVGEQLNNALTSLGAEITIELRNAFDDIANMPEFKDALTYDIRDPHGNILISNPQVESSWMVTVRSILPSMGIYSMGTVALGLSNPAALACAGIFVLTTLFSNKTTAQINALRQQYKPQIDVEIGHLRTFVSQKFSDFEDEIKKVLSTEIDSITAELSRIKVEMTRATTNAQAIRSQRGVIENSIKNAETQKKLIDSFGNPFKK